MFGYPSKIKTESGTAYPFNLERQTHGLLQGAIHVATSPPAEGDLAEFDQGQYLLIEVFPGDRIAGGPMSNLINSRFYLSAAPANAQITGATITGTSPAHISEHSQTVEADEAGKIVRSTARALIRRQDCTAPLQRGRELTLVIGDQQTTARIEGKNFSEHPRYYDLNLVFEQ